MNNLALTGVAGYIAPRHLAAIKNTGNNLIAAVDLNDPNHLYDAHTRFGLRIGANAICENH